MPRRVGPAASESARGRIHWTFEGCVLHMYNDPTRNATIGVGT